MGAKLTRSRVVMVFLKVNLKHYWITRGGRSSEVGLWPWLWGMIFITLVELERAAHSGWQHFPGR